MEISNPRSTKPRFLKDTKVISIKVHIGIFLEDQNSNFCHSAAKKSSHSKKYAATVKNYIAIAVILYPVNQTF